MKEFVYKWSWDLNSSPENLWKLIADTNRFNFETGVPPIKRTGAPARKLSQALKLYRFGIPIEWDEEPFEWVYPAKYSVVRSYKNGPVKRMTVHVELIRRPGDHTTINYQVNILPANITGLLAIPYQVGWLSKKNFEKVIRKYDRIASFSNTELKPYSHGTPNAIPARLNSLAEPVRQRLKDKTIIDQLLTTLIEEDDLTLTKMRAYTFAKKWNTDPKETLETFLYSTKAGLLDLSWDILCPYCRGVQLSTVSLKDVSTPVHCDSCKIDFNLNFHQLVEITFRPNPTVRKIDISNYCIGGPQITPHIILQQILKTDQTKQFPVTLEKGSYRIRTNTIANGILLRVGTNGLAEYSAEGNGKQFPDFEAVVAENCTISFTNTSSDDQLFIFERMNWADDIVTASEITTLQTFRDLYSSEALRPGEQISVGSVTLLFTDLKNSTVMYRNIGDAAAFGIVMNHFDILRECIRENNGALVKTIGDAVMAVFTEPLDGLKAITDSIGKLTGAFTNGEIILKAGIHHGHCIAVNLNDTFDYFGSTVNIAARLEGLSTGNEVILSGPVYNDSDVQNYLEKMKATLAVSNFETNLKGFAEEKFDVYRLKIVLAQ